MLKRIVSLLAALALLITAAAALGETSTWLEELPHVAMTAECASFTGELPADLAAAFSAPQWQELRFLCGACCMQKSNLGTGDPYALAAFEGADGVVLAALSAVDGLWRIDQVLPNAVLPGRSFSIRAHIRNRFEIIYPTDGGEETFTVHPYWLGDAQAREVSWVLESYMRTEPDGSEFRIETSFDGYGAHFFVVNGKDYPALYPCYLEYLNLSEFPRTEAEVQALCAALPQYAAEKGIAVACASEGVTLREGPGTSTRSLAKIYNGAPVRILRSVTNDEGGEWHQVRAGILEGYIYHPYVSKPETADIAQTLNAIPPRVGRVSADATLYEKADSGSKAIAQLAAGAEFHILGQADGWLLIGVSHSGVSWWMDVHDLYGFIPAAEVVQAATLGNLRRK